FHGKPRWEEGTAHAADAHDAHEKHETHTEEGHGAHGDHGSHDDAHGHHGGPPQKEMPSMYSALIALAIPSVIIGAMTFKSLLFGGGFGESIYFSEEHREVLHEIGESVGNW